MDKDLPLDPDPSVTGNKEEAAVFLDGSKGAELITTTVAPPPPCLNQNYCFACLSQSHLSQIWFCFPKNPRSHGLDAVEERRRWSRSSSSRWCSVAAEKISAGSKSNLNVSLEIQCEEFGIAAKKMRKLWTVMAREVLFVDDGKPQFLG